jgi:predicted ATPase
LLLADRAGTAVRLRDDAGSWRAWHDAIRPYDSMLSEIADPRSAPELLEMRERVRSWRFYDHVRTDSAAPARIAQIGTRTPVLAPDGADLAAALQTIREIGDADALDRAVDAAFPGSRISIDGRAGRFDLALHQHGLLRSLSGAELSDGTLRYLLWVAVLLTPRPPELLVLNEPETSLHPDLLRPLGALIAEAAARSQVVIVSHARRLVEALSDADAYAIELVKELGETVVADQAPLERPAWQWPKR